MGLLWYNMVNEPSAISHRRPIMPDKVKKAKRDTPTPVPVDLGGVRYSVKVYTADQIDKMLADLPSVELIEQHIANRDNPHEVTKAQVGLGNADNTSDKNKPLSDADLDALKRKVNVKEPWDLEWTEGGETHSAERVLNNVRAWLLHAFSKTWIIEDNGEGRWRASIDNEQTWTDGVIAESIQDPGSVTFTIDGEDYQFTVLTRSVLVHIMSTNNPHNVTGQQVGVLDSSGKIKSNLVDTASIMDQKVTTAKLAYNSVPESRLQGNASSGITSSHFQDNSFNGQKIVAASVSKEKLSTTVQDAIDKNVNASVSVQSPSHVVTQAGGLIIKGLDENWWSIGIDANGDIYKTRVDPPTLSTNMASKTETLPDDYMASKTETPPDDYMAADDSNE